MYPPQGPPPQGYPPYGAYPPPYPYVQQPMRVQRSGVPRVIGILAIIFACIGVGMAAIFTAGPLSDIDKWHLYDQLHAEVTWIYLSAGISVLVFALHLVAGISAVRYRRAAPKLITFYAIFALAFAIGDIIISVALFPKTLEGADWFVSAQHIKESVVTPRAGYEVMALVWPVIALIMMNLRRSKEACGEAANAKPQDVF